MGIPRHLVDRDDLEPARAQLREVGAGSEDPETELLREWLRVDAVLIVTDHEGFGPAPCEDFRQRAFFERHRVEEPEAAVLPSCDGHPARDPAGRGHPPFYHPE